MSAASVTLEPWPKDPYTGIVTSFRGYLLLTRSESLPPELRGLCILADPKSPENRAYRIENGELVATYCLEFK